jgi:type IV pilus assembly protein PilC
MMRGFLMLRLFQMKYRVTVRDADGKDETGVMDVENRFGVYEKVEKQGKTVVAIEEVSSGFALPSWAKLQMTSDKVKMDERITFTKNLAAMLSAGLTLARALSVIERQATNKAVKNIALGLSDSVKAGTPLHDALKAYPKVFPPLYMAMTKAGEESGTLAESLRVVAKQMERSYTLSKKIKGAMIYPGIIVFAIIVISILMLIFVVPTLAATFAQLGTKLPLATQIILNVSNFITGNLALFILCLVVFFACVLYAGRSKPGQSALMWVGLHMPVIKTLIRETFSARAARSLASLLASGVEMLTAITITRDIVGNPRFSVALTDAEALVRKGEPLSKAFEDHADLYPVFFADMVAVGEETGKVSDMLAQVAEYYEEDVEEQTKDLSTIIEPILMLLIGAVVGVFAVAMIAPIYSISSAIN